MFQEKKYQGHILDYIKRNLAKGYSKESLKWTLVKQGNSKVEVEKAIEQAEMEISREKARSIEKPIITQSVEPLTQEQMPKQSFLGKVKGWFS